MNVCVVALGKIGLPVAVQIASKGHRVIGCDVDAGVVASVKAGTPPFRGEAGLDELLAQVTRDGNLTSTTDVTGTVGASDVVVVLVPLSVDASAKPDFGALDAATASIGSGLQPDTLVVYETTLPVGVTRQRLAPALAAASGLTPGRDLFVAFSPERVRSGRILSDLRRYPKIVGGIDDESTSRAVRFYEAVLDFDPPPDLTRGTGVWAMGSAEEAELAKLTDTTYRDVNIALANEFAQYADRIGADIGRVIEAANSQLQAYILDPGMVGGHCIPVYPHLYLSGHTDARLPAMGRAVNDAVPAYAVSRLGGAVGDLAGRRVAVLGLAYRGGVKEAAFSGAFGLVAELVRVGAEPAVHDPLYSDDEIRAFGLAPYHLGDPVDAAIVQADHAEYRTLAPDDLPGAHALLDARDVTDPARWTGVARLLLGQP